jgi:hypothetical protein
MAVAERIRTIGINGNGGNLSRRDGGDEIARLGGAGENRIIKMGGSKTGGNKFGGDGGDGGDSVRRETTVRPVTRIEVVWTSASAPKRQAK